jgi:putative ABC transport system ATP-binding protein
MIKLLQVTKTFNAGKDNEFTALRGIDLSIAVNEITVLKGPSGSGKTTLLSIIGGMSRPTTGRVIANGREMTSLPERFLAEIRRKTFGFVFQSYNLIPGISVLENVALPAYPEGLPHRAMRGRAQELLEQLKIDSKAGLKVELLSGGEQQRVAIARALMNQPASIIADEPTAHLDTELAEEFMGIVSDLHERGKTIIIATHDPLICDAPIVHRTIELRDGKILKERTGH